MAAGAAWLLLLLSARCMDFDTPSPPHSCDDGAHGELVSMMTGAVGHHSMVAIPTTMQGVDDPNCNAVAWNRNLSKCRKKGNFSVADAEWGSKKNRRSFDFCYISQSGLPLNQYISDNVALM